VRVAEEYLPKAEECERKAAQVNDPPLRQILLTWRANGAIWPSNAIHRFLGVRQVMSKSKP
jgi:hypothetical protein